MAVVLERASEDFFTIFWFIAYIILSDNRVANSNKSDNILSNLSHFPPTIFDLVK